VHDKFPILPLDPPTGISKKFFLLAPLGLGVNQEKEFFGFREFCRSIPNLRIAWFLVQKLYFHPLKNELLGL